MPAAWIATVVAVGVLRTLLIAQGTKPEAIQQIVIRTAPHLLNRMASLMTGLARAFALARKEVSDHPPRLRPLPFPWFPSCSSRQSP